MVVITEYTAIKTIAGLNNGIEPDFGSAVVEGAYEVAGSPKIWKLRCEESEKTNLPVGWVEQT